MFVSLALIKNINSGQALIMLFIFQIALSYYYLINFVEGLKVARKLVVAYNLSIIDRYMYNRAKTIDYNGSNDYRLSVLKFLRNVRNISRQSTANKPITTSSCRFDLSSISSKTLEDPAVFYRFSY